MNKTELAEWRDYTNHLSGLASATGDYLAASLYLIVSSALNGLLSRDEILVEEATDEDPASE